MGVLHSAKELALILDVELLSQVGRDLCFSFLDRWMGLPFGHKLLWENVDIGSRVQLERHWVAADVDSLNQSECDSSVMSFTVRLPSPKS